METLLVFDLDGTLIRKNAGAAFCIFLFKRKILNFRKITKIFLFYFIFKLNKISIADLYYKIFDYAVKGLCVSELCQLLPTFFQELFPACFREKVMERFNEASQRGHSTWILSSSPQFIVEAIGRLLGASESRGTSYILDKQGRIEEIHEVMDGNKKATIIKEILKQANGSLELIAFSDSIHDVSFLAEATTAVAVFPDRALRKRAVRNQWEIIQ